MRPLPPDQQVADPCVRDRELLKVVRRNVASIRRNVPGREAGTLSSPRTLGPDLTFRQGKA